MKKTEVVKKEIKSTNKQSELKVNTIKTNTTNNTNNNSKINPNVMVKKDVKTDVKTGIRTNTKIENNNDNIKLAKLFKIENSTKENDNFISQDLMPSNQKIKFYNHQNFIKTIFEMLKSSNKQDYKDELFPPNNDSLYGKCKRESNEEVEEEDKRDYESIKEWKQAHNILFLNSMSQENNKLNITIDGFDGSNLVQGSLSDCYFLSALVSLTKYPYLIRNLFFIIDIEKIKEDIKNNNIPKFNNTNEERKYIISYENHFSYSLMENILEINQFYHQNYDKLKMFFIRLRLHGEWHYMVLDSYFPSVNNNLIFGRSKSNDLWVAIIEKAWAKVLGGYYMTSLGSPSEGLLSLTDFPITIITHKHYKLSSEIWSQLPLINKTWILSCIIQLKGSKTNTYRNLGLITNHCYGILNYQEIKTKINSKGYRIILLRNPHGNQDYMGSFGDQDPVWNKDKELKEKALFNNKDEASFFMDFNEYFQLFDHTFVSKHIENYESIYYKLSKKDSIKNYNKEDPSIKGNMYTNCFILKVNDNIPIDNTEFSGSFIQLVNKYKRALNYDVDKNVSKCLIAYIKDEEFIKNIESNNNSKQSNVSDELILNKIDFNNDIINVEFINGLDNDKSLSLSVGDIFNKKGYYLIYTRVLAGIKHPLGYVINFYLNEKLVKNYTLRRIITNNHILYLRSILLNQCSTKINKEVYPNGFCEISSYKQISLNDLKNGFGVICINNNNNKGEISTIVILKEFLNLRFLHEYSSLLKEKDNNTNTNSSVDVNKAINLNLKTPSESFIFLIFEKIKMRCGFAFTCQENYSFSDDDAKSMIKLKGSKTEAKVKGNGTGVYIYSMKYGKGIMILVENTGSKECKLTFIFTKLLNLTPSIKLNVKDNSFDFSLSSKSEKYLDFKVVDKGTQTSIEYKYSVQFK